MATQLLPTSVDGMSVLLVVAPVIASGDTIVPIKMSYGSGAPSNDVGDEKDFYMNIDNYWLYGPKLNGLWGTGINLKGEDGGPGPAGDINLEKIQVVNGPVSTGNVTVYLDLAILASVFVVKLNAPGNNLVLQNTASAEGIARSFTMVVEQGTGGNAMTTWDSKIRFKDGIPPKLSYQVGKRDVFHYLSLDQGDSFMPFYVGNGYPV